MDEMIEFEGLDSVSILNSDGNIFDLSDTIRNSGTYSVITYLEGCMSTTILDINIAPLFPKPDIEDFTICGTQVHLTFPEGELVNRHYRNIHDGDDIY